MSFIWYDDTYVPVPKGFPNMGNTCYLNSFLQCILSCPAIYCAISKKNEGLNALLKSLYITQSPVILRKIWKEIIEESKKSQSRVKLDEYSQHDANEGVMILLDKLGGTCKNITTHRYRIDLTCSACKFVSSNRAENNIFFIEGPTERPLEQFLQRRYSLHDGYTCTKCGDKKTKITTWSITMLPEILIILLEKYTEKTLIDYPEFMSFTGSSGKQMKYRLVAQSEQSGGQSSGHYWANIYRGGKWYKANDDHISESEFTVSRNSYLLFYHIMKD